MIHKGFLFTQLGGFPVNQQRLEYMQEAYTGIADALVGLVGANAIVSGCVVSGNNVSAGWVVIGGELLPFLGSSTGVQTTVLVRETKTALTFKDNSNHEVQFNRVAQFGTGTGAIAWASLKRINSLVTITTNLNAHTENEANPHKVTKSQVGLSNIPNAKTDDPSISSSDILATSAMVNAAKDNVYKGRALAVKSTNNAKVTLPVLLDIEKYIITTNGCCVYPEGMTVFFDGFVTNSQVRTANSKTEITFIYRPDQIGPDPTEKYYVTYIITKIA